MLNHHFKLSSITFTFLLLSFFAFAQENENSILSSDTTEIRLSKEANRNKATINGVYVPIDIYDAIQRIIELTPANALEKFKNAPEEGIDRKLHFGLGKWMIVNWYFYEGSRLENHINQLGLSHPDDMADLLIICLHRKLNNRELEIPKMVKKLADIRNKKLLDRKMIIDTSEVKNLKIKK
jgi:hypothetical protein